MVTSLSMRFTRSPIFSKDPQLIVAKDKTSADLRVAFRNHQIGTSQLCVEIRSPSREQPNKILMREKCAQLQVHPVENCSFIAEPSLMFVSQMGKPVMLNLSLTCRPYVPVYVPLTLSNEHLASLSVSETNFTVRQWHTRLVGIRGTAVNKSMPFEVTAGPLETRDLRYKGKKETFKMWNRDYADDCTAENKDAWWCVEQRKTTSNAINIHHYGSSIMATMVVLLLMGWWLH
jgi:hypothetical protein